MKNIERFRGDGNPLVLSQEKTRARFEEIACECVSLFRLNALFAVYLVFEIF